MSPNQSNVDILRGGYDAFARGDVAAVLALFDAGIEWYSPEELPGGGTYRGPEEVAGFFATIPEHYQELAVRPERFLAAGEEVVVQGTTSGRVGGVAFAVGFAHVWRLREGRAVRFREYLDSGKLLGLFASAPATAGTG